MKRSIPPALPGFFVPARTVDENGEICEPENLKETATVDRVTRSLPRVFRVRLACAGKKAQSTRRFRGRKSAARHR